MEPTRPEWENLYKLASEFKKLAPWEWMWDSDIFGVRDPETDEVGYCSVMGALGQFFGLGVYLGSEGLLGFLKMQERGSTMSPREALELQNGLIVSFTDRGDLTNRDIKIIKELGLKFKGPKEWPMFRSYKPGYYPWYINSEEARLLTVVLEQAINVVTRLKEDPELFEPLNQNLILVRTLRKLRNKTVWQDEWLSPKIYEKSKIFHFTSEGREILKNIKNELKPKGVWEIGAFVYDILVHNAEGRPFFPRAIVWVDHSSDFIFKILMVEPAEYEDKVAEGTIDLINTLGFFPEKILTYGENIYEISRLLGVMLDIEVEKTNRINALEHIKRDMRRYLSKDNEKTSQRSR